MKYTKESRNSVGSSRDSGLSGSQDLCSIQFFL
jgi:hypothetical protein